MPDSLFNSDFQEVYSGTGTSFHASPADWRDCPIYFLMVDRFSDPASPPRHRPFDDPDFSGFQGGKFAGVKANLGYIKSLGAGAIWLSPVLKNLPFEDTYHGYGIHDFLVAEPRFALDPLDADDELRDLVDTAHATGLYVIFDIVLNHVGDVFAYDCQPGDTLCTANVGSQASYSPSVLSVRWRDANGNPLAADGSIEGVAAPSRDAAIWPMELQQDRFFRRQGVPGPGDDTIGDFDSLKQLMTIDNDLQDHLIRAYQYVIARFDIDGFRIDTLRYLKGGLPLLFGNSIREYALSIGKKNFFTFGEVWTNDSEGAIADFIGRNTQIAGDLVGVDAALDYPLFDVLKPTVKGFSPPSDVVGMYQHRKAVENGILSSHGDATRFFVTFLDNHDVKERVRHLDPAMQPALDDEVTLGMACLAFLPGIPCVYYGTEQGLTGAGSDPAVREALWGKPGGFDPSGGFFSEIAKIYRVRSQEPALRYGRTYFRQLSGNGVDFGFSHVGPGVLAFSRILNDREMLVVANTSKQITQNLHVLVDNVLNPAGRSLTVLYSNKPTTGAPVTVDTFAADSVEQSDGSSSAGMVNAVTLTLVPGEVRALG